LRVELAEGHTTPIIVRNSSIPTENSVTLTAYQSGHGGVLLRILAGESVWAKKNLSVTEMSIPLLGVDSELEVTLDIDANSSLSIAVRDTTNNKVFKKAVGLRQDIEGTESRETETPSRGVLLIRNPVSFRPVPDVRQLSIEVIEQWVCRSATQAVLRTVGPEAWGGWWLDVEKWLLAHGEDRLPSNIASAKVFHTFSFQRELVIDALEQAFHLDLDAARHSVSIRSVSEKVLAAISRFSSCVSRTDA
jgi:hypothetical protein